MRAFTSGVAVGLVLGVFFGIYLGRFGVAVQATGIGFGAGLGIFLLGALIRYGYGGRVFPIVDSLPGATPPKHQVSTKPGQLQWVMSLGAVVSSRPRVSERALHISFRRRQD